MKLIWPLQSILGILTFRHTHTSNILRPPLVYCIHDTFHIQSGYYTMSVAMPQPLNITLNGAAETVEKFELCAAYDAPYDECRAGISRASSPSSVYSERPGPVSVALRYCKSMHNDTIHHDDMLTSDLATSPSSVYSTRPTTICAPSVHHNSRCNDTLQVPSRPRLTTSAWRS